MKLHERNERNGLQAYRFIVDSAEVVARLAVVSVISAAAELTLRR
jgi:hypothetical protein